MKQQIFWLLVLLVIFSPIGFAEDVIVQRTSVVSNFDTSGSSTHTLCSYDLTTDNVLVRNQGTIDDTYSIQIVAESPVSSWVTVAESVFSLAPGEDKLVPIYVATNGDVTGTFQYTLLISSAYDGVREVTKTLNVQSCENIGVTPIVTGQQTCPCTTGAYVFSVVNTGRISETYALALDSINPAFYELSESTVTLAAGEHKEVYAYVRMACSYYGTFDFTLLAQGVHSGSTVEVPLSLQIAQACYAYNAAIGQELPFVEDSVAVTFMPKADTAYAACESAPFVIPVYLQNPSEITNSYTLHVEDAKPWIYPAEGTVQLGGAQEYVSSIIVNTASANPGVYSFAVKVSSNRGDLQTVLPFTVEVQDCVAQEVERKFVMWGLVGLAALILLTIFILLLILLLRKRDGDEKEVKKVETKKAAKVAKKEPNRFVVWFMPKYKAAKKKAKEIWRKVKSKAKKHKSKLKVLLPLLLFFLIIALLGYKHMAQDGESIVEDTTDAVSGTIITEPLLEPWQSGLILLALLLLLLLLLWWKRRKSKPKKVVKKEKKASWKERTKAWFFKAWNWAKPFLKWLWIILLLLLLLTGLVAGTYFLFIAYKDSGLLTAPADSQGEDEVEVIAGMTPEEQEQVAALEAQVADLEGNIADKEDALTDLENELNDLIVQALESEDDEEIAALENEILASQEKIDSLLLEIQVLYDERDALLADLAALQEQVDVLEEDVAGIEENVAGIEENVSGIEEDVSDIHSELSALQEQIAALEALVGQLNDKDAQIESLLEEIASLQEEILRLQEERDALEAAAAQAALEAAAQKEEENNTQETDEGEDPIQNVVVSVVDEQSIPEIDEEDFLTILAFDVSLSGQIIEGGQSRFSRGIDEARKFIQEEGTYSIMIVGKNALFVKREAQPHLASQALLTLRPLDTQSNLGKALYAAKEELGDRHGRIVLVSDLVTTDDADIFAIHDEFEAEGIDVVFIDVNYERNEAPVTFIDKVEIIEEVEEPVVEEEETQAPIFDVADQDSGFFIEIPENTRYVIDLANYFSDADADTLVYDAIPGEHLSAVIEGSIVTLVPEAEWVGETSIVFSADDSKGGVTETPAIRVTVIEGEEGTYDYVPQIILGSLILLIVIAIISGAFAKKFNKAPQIPKEEE